MKVVILAGGLGTRLSEETTLKPKPMVEIGGRPILWHLMKIYSAQGFNDFVICCGYKGYLIKEYFSNYNLHLSDVTFDFAKGTTEIHRNSTENWRVTLVDTGENTMTGGRLKRVADYLNPDEDFCFTYGDGLADISLKNLIDFHRSQKRTATVTVTRPSGRFGATQIDGDQVKAFIEKPSGDNQWINGGFFVLKPRALEYIDGDSSIWERAPLENLAKDGELSAFKHSGFWQPMDTLREKQLLESLWDQGKAPWKIWP
ncbi:MAG: glucose-1-phosphate cytidylyltransferase [Bdellovibrionales bacterium]|nr:glucose-1-phosphate cytidylyltransferase [Bdellovibrionales bacterium]